MFHHIQLLQVVPTCSSLVPPCTTSPCKQCTTLYHAGTRQYIPVHTSTYCHRNNLCRYVLACTILRFLVPPCIHQLEGTYRLVQVYTTLYCLVPGVQDSRCVLTCTVLSGLYQTGKSCTELNSLVQVHTGTYQYVLICLILSRYTGFQIQMCKWAAVK